MDIIRALLYKIPNAQFSLMGDKYKDINWLDARPIPTEIELQTAFDEYTSLEIDPLKSEDYSDLWTRLSKSAAMVKCYIQARIALSTFFAVYKLEQIVLITHDAKDLKVALTNLQTEMGSLLTVADITEMNSILTKKGFKIKL